MAGTDRLWVEDTGEGPPVVLIHPGIHDSTVWDTVVPLLEDLRSIRYDARDFGRSSASTQPFRAVDDLLAVLDARGLEAAHLVGNSMGGASALSAALEAPSRVLSLTVMCTAIAGYPWPDDDPDLENAWAEASASGDPQQVAEVSARIWCAAGTDAALEAQLLAAATADANHDAHEQDGPEHWSRVGEIAVPAAVVVGERDVASMVTANTDLAAAIAGAELVRLSEADHLPSLRDPRAVAEVVRRTVARAG
ncbi:alpha/beta hydrolase [Marmoricola endophyticus]|uniref:Alpha/beta hydrolase n=1 Tax=Marmoricola endophyticus TaxID=2040280 RepID=A0A917BT96_9ACTN|nr:alpha/beta hydrolase [Marmoricola endophyticus]